MRHLLLKVKDLIKDRLQLPSLQGQQLLPVRWGSCFDEIQRLVWEEKAISPNVKKREVNKMFAYDQWEWEMEMNYRMLISYFRFYWHLFIFLFIPQKLPKLILLYRCLSISLIPFILPSPCLSSTQFHYIFPLQKEKIYSVYICMAACLCLIVMTFNSCDSIQTKKNKLIAISTLI